MATQFAKECRFPEDLEAATIAMQELISDRFADNMALIKAAQDSGANLDGLLDQGNALLQNMLLQGDSATSIRNLSDLSTEFGLLDEDPSLSDKEAFASQSGVIIFDGVVYLPGSSSPDASQEDNISILRRVYLAVGRSLDLVEQLYAEPKAVVTHSSLGLTKVRAKRPGEAFSLIELKGMLAEPYLTAEQYVVLEDYSVLVLRSQYLSQNESLLVTSRKFGIPIEQIGVSVFHQNAVDNSTASINRFQNYGFLGPKLSSILAGQDLVNSPQSPIQAQLNSEYEEAQSIIEFETFIDNRFSTLDALNKTNFRNRVSARISALSVSHLNTLADSLFQVAVIREHDTLAHLRTKHSDDAIERLLEERPDITGLWWAPPDDAFQRALDQAVQSAPPGSSTISNRFLNNKTFSKVDLKEFMNGLGDLSDANLANPLTKFQLSTSTRNLNEFKSRQPLRSFSSLAEGAALASEAQSPALSGATTNYDTLSGQPPPSVGGVTGTSVSGSPLQGQPSAASPAGVLTDLFDPGLTLDFSNRIAEVTKAANDTLSILYPPEIAAPLARICNILASLFEQSMRTCAKSVETARVAILPLKNKLDSFMSRFLTLTGSGSYQKSILKCTTVNVGLMGPDLDSLTNIIGQIATVAGSFLSAVAAWSANLVDKVICLSSNLLDSFLGNTLPVPTACVTPRIDLGPGLNTALSRLKFVGVAKTSVFGVFGRDTVRLKVMVEAAPSKTRQFKAATGCSAPQISDFFNKSMLQVKIPKIG